MRPVPSGRTEAGAGRVREDPGDRPPARERFDPTSSWSAAHPTAPMTREPARAVVSWSAGKDSAYALWEVVRAGELEVVGLLTTVTQSFGRVSMHGVREALVEQQAEAIGVPLWKVPIPSPCPNEVYERAMGETLARLAREGVREIVFGDLFLQDIREYRESRLASTGIRPVFPLWKRDTRQLAHEMVRAGLKASVVCLDPRKLSREFAGRPFDERFLRDLPSSVDPCGENGEFHTFVWAGPMFARSIAVEVGATVEREGFVFTDMLPGPTSAPDPSGTDPRGAEARDPAIRTAGNV